LGHSERLKGSGPILAPRVPDRRRLLTGPDDEVFKNSNSAKYPLTRGFLSAREPVRNELPLDAHEAANLAFSRTKP